MLAGELIRDRAPWTSPFSRVSGALFVSIACLLDGAIAATIGATALCGKIFAAPRVLVDKWLDWMLSNAGAAILLTPFLLLGRAHPTFLQVARKQPGVFLMTTATSILAVGYLLFRNYRYSRSRCRRFVSGITAPSLDDGTDVSTSRLSHAPPKMNCAK